MKILSKTTILAAALGTAATLQTAQASLSTDNLADLVANGGSLTIGDKTFSGFSYTDTGLTSFAASSIIVTASVDANGVDYLTWTGNMSYVSGSSSASSADLLLQYVVTANPGSISMIDQSYTGGTQNGQLNIDETVATGTFGGPVVASSQLTTTLLTETTGPNLNVNPAENVLYVTKDLSFDLFGAGSATVSSVSQSFHQTAVPEPSTVVAGALLLLPFGVSTLRILRKNKAA